MEIATIILTYITSTQIIVDIGKKIQQLLRNYYRLQDSYKFIREFGKQTYPVVEGD